LWGFIPMNPHCSCWPGLSLETDWNRRDEYVESGRGDQLIPERSEVV